MGKASAVTHLKARRQPRSQAEDAASGFLPDMARDQLLKLAKTYLAERGVEWPLATKLGIEALNGTEIKTVLGYRRHDAALKIPYRSATGKRLEYCRLRYLGDTLPVDRDGDKIRYQQRKGTDPDLYIPAVPGVDWKAILADPGQELILTEGEVKAICATVRGIHTLALGGVWSFRSAPKGIDLLPALKAIAWTGRRVTIVFDSDLASNPDVRRAQGYLAEVLAQQGADVRIQNVPAPPVDPGAAPTGEKMPKAGLDDFMVRVEREGGVAAQAVREEILGPAEEYAACQALWSMNWEAAVIKDSSRYLVFETGKTLNRQEFTQTYYADRKYRVAVEGENGQPTFKTVKTAQTWNEWPHRMKVEGITYEPGKPAFVGGYWNNWRGWGIEPRPGDVDWWLRLARYLTQREPAALDTLIQWFAWQLHNPGRLTYGTLVWGPTQGTGKTALAAPFAGDPQQKIVGIFGANASFIRSEQMHANFQEVLAFKQFVQVEEVSGNRGDRRQDADRFKNTVYAGQISINRKYQPEITIRNTINLYLTSNHPDALFLERTDRRWFVIQTPREKEKAEFYARYFRAASDPRNVAALFHYMLNEVDVSRFNPDAPPTTAAKLAMMGASETPLGDWAAQLREDPTFLVRGKKPGATEEDVAPLWSSEQLLSRIRKDLSNDRIDKVSLGRELARKGFEQVHDGKLVKTTAGRKRLWAIRDADRWLSASHEAIAAEWEGSHQKPKPKKKF